MLLCMPQVTVVIRHMFSPQEAEAGGTAFTQELEADVAAECAKMGALEKVRLLRADAWPLHVLCARMHACMR
jgi:hypothetical protein